MNDSEATVYAWTRVGALCGIGAALSYAGAAFVPLPDLFSYVLAFAFGPLLIVAFMGVYQFLKAHCNLVTLQIATVFGIVAGLTANLMIVVQLAIRAHIHQLLLDANDDSMRETLRQIAHAMDAVHWGFDVSWDVFLGIATILMGIAILRHPKMGIGIGGPGIALGAALLVLNLWTFPVPPADAGFFDVGPLVAIFYVALSIRMLSLLNWLSSKSMLHRIGKGP